MIGKKRRQELETLLLYEQPGMGRGAYFEGRSASRDINNPAIWDKAQLSLQREWAKEMIVRGGRSLRKMDLTSETFRRNNEQRR